MKINVKNPSLKDIDLMKELWQTCFHDDYKYINFFFDNCFKSELALVAYIDSDLAGMLFMLDSVFYIDNKVYKGKYLYAVCTSPKYRNKGIMRELEFNAKEKAKVNKLDFICLVPANESLFSMYEKLGYFSLFNLQHKVLKLENKCLNSNVILKLCEKEKFISLRKAFLSKKSCFLDFTDDFHNYRYDEFLFADAEILLVKINNQEHYVAGYKNKDAFFIKETTLSNNKIEIVLNAIALKKNVCTFDIRGVDNFLDALKPFGMFKWVSDNKDIALTKKFNPYMNMMLDY